MEHIRVVVQLNSSITSDNNNFNNNDNEVPHNSKIEEPLNPQMCAEVQLIDCKTVQLHLNEIDSTAPTTSIVNNMTFDYVSYASEHCLKSEISTLMDELLLQRCNCCLVRFAPQRECHLAFLYNVLITEVNNRLAQLNASVHYIRVIHNDILPGGVRNMLQGDEQSVAKYDNKVAHSTKNRAPYIKDQFGCTRELLLWLLNDYRLKWPDCEGHEVLEFHFYILSAQQRPFKVKFALFNVYLDRMDLDARSQWHKYMRHINDATQTDFPHSPLSSYLRCHVEAAESGRTLLLFNVPIDVHSTLDTVELLQMANAVMTNRKKENLALIGNLLRRGSFASLASRNSVDSDVEVNSSAKTLRSKYASTPRSVSFTVPLETNIETHKSFRRRFATNHYSSKDFNSLSTWYRKIDGKFLNARDFLEKHVDRLYNKQVTQICNNIKAVSMSTTGDVHQNQDQSSSHLKASMDMNDLDHTNEHFQEIYNGSESFDFCKQITEEIECSKYYDVLKIYLETKRFDLSQYVLNLKIKQLENCQVMLTNTIEEVLSTLNSMLFRESENGFNN